MSYRALLFVAATGLACSGGGESRAPLPDAGGQASGRVRITLTVSSSGETVLGAEARLLRFRDMDGEAAHVLAGQVNPSSDAIPLSRCVRLDPEKVLDSALAQTTPET